MQTPALAQPMGWRLALTFAVAALLFLSPWPQSMAQNILGLSMSLVDRGSVELDGVNNNDVAVRDGRTLSGLPPGASFVAALVYWCTRPLLGLLPVASRLTALYVLCSVLVGIPAAAATVYLTYRTAVHWGASARTALLTAGLLAFGTMHFGYATGFYKKTLATACLMGAFALLSEQREKPGSLRTGLAGFLCGLAIGQDYPTCVIAMALAVYLLWRRPGLGSVLTFAVGAALAILPVLVYHQAAFGAPWRTAYQFRTDPAGSTLGYPSLGSCLFLLCTLLATSPCLIWSAVGWWRAIRIRERRAEMVMLASAVLAMLVFCSGWASFYPHEASFASRQILPIIPFAVLPMAFGFPAMLRGWGLVVMVWPVGATLLATQAAMIPSMWFPQLYALKVFGTSWGTGALFSEALASWLNIPTLHGLIARKLTTSAALLQPENRLLLLKALWGQALIKVISVTVSAIAVALLWRFVWRPVVYSPTSQRRMTWRDMIRLCNIPPRLAALQSGEQAVGFCRKTS